MRKKVTKRDQAYFDSLTKNRSRKAPAPAVSDHDVIGKKMYLDIKNMAIEQHLFMKSANWDIAFVYAETEGLIDKLSNAEKEMYMDNVGADLKHEALMSSDREAIKDILANTELLAGECRKRYMKSHFQKMTDGRIN